MDSVHQSHAGSVGAVCDKTYMTDEIGGCCVTLENLIFTKEHGNLIFMFFKCTLGNISISYCWP